MFPKIKVIYYNCKGEGADPSPKKIHVSCRQDNRKVIDMINKDLIEAKRIEHGYSQEKMAELLGLGHRGTYCNKIKGTRPFTIEEIVKICKLFQLQPNDLIVMN